MNDAALLDHTMKALVLVLLLSLPSILVASVLGVLVSLLQALTQIQEQTLAFALKLIAVTVTIALTARWIGGELYNFSLNIFDSFPMMFR